MMLALGTGVGLVGLGAGVGVVALADPPKTGYPPDPSPGSSTKQWVFTIVAKEGVVSLGPAKSVTVAKPETTARIIGRFALELWCGKELLDRVRFNVPGMGDGPHPADRRVLKKPAMDRITTHFNVKIADNPRTNNAKLVDRATGDETPIAWPPDAPDVAGSASAVPSASAAAPPSASVSASPSATPPKSAAAPG